VTVKQVIIIRRDLNMRRGKEIAQGSHASAAWLLDRLKAMDYGATQTGVCHRAHLTLEEMDWIQGSYRKVVCQVEALEELEALHAAAQEAGLRSYLVTDLGATEFKGVPTVTALAIGPDLAEKIDPITSGLRLY
jgi:peptidyl-tRNA hydrolase, PTH2 family